MARAPVPIDLNRRQFILGALGSLFGGGLLSFADHNRELSLDEFFKHCSKSNVRQIGLTYFARDFKLSTFQGHKMWLGRNGAAFLLTPFGTYARFPVSIPAHSFCQHPSDPSLVWAIPGLDKVAVLYDLKTGRTVDEIEIPGLSFYGHGQFVPGERAVIMTMYDSTDLNRGMLIKADLRSKKILKSLRTQNDSFHELLHVPRRGSYFVAGKNRHGACFYEVGDAHLDIRRAIPFPDRHDFRHLEKLKDGRVFVTGFGDSPDRYPHNMTGIAVVDVDASKITAVEISPQDAHRFAGEALNFIFNDEQTLAYLANPYKGYVYLIDLKAMTLVEVRENKLIKAFRKINGKYLSLGVAKGLTRSFFFVSDTLDSMDKGEIPVEDQPSGFGSHLQVVTLRS